MANIKSALKRARQTEVRTARNKAGRTRLKTAAKALAAAAKSGDKATTTASAIALTSLAARAAVKGLIHKNKSARIASRAAKAANKLAKS
jgi:small subunit ribosomal protein S20